MKFDIKTFLILLVLTVILIPNTFAADPPFLKYKDDPWVIDHLGKLSLDEKIAQLMVVTIYPRQGEAGKDESA